jgi:ABC-type phosphate/phosphonate transport system ATPase subunit
MGKGIFFFFKIDLSLPSIFQSGPFSLKNIMFNAHPGDLICIIGSVGAGKVSY